MIFTITDISSMLIHAVFELDPKSTGDYQNYFSKWPLSSTKMIAILDQNNR